MSKWKLLKSAITGKPDINTDTDDVSIHRFKGFEVVSKRKVIWKGFNLQINMKPVETDGVSEQCSCGADQGRNKADDPFKDCCQVCSSRIQHFDDFLNNSYEFLSGTDIQESLIQVECTGETPHLERLEQLIREGERLKKYRLQHLKKTFVNCNRTENAIAKSSDGALNSLKAAFYIQAASLESSSQSCQYCVYDLTYGSLESDRDSFSERRFDEIFFEENLIGNESRKCYFSDKQNTVRNGSTSNAETGGENNIKEEVDPHISQIVNPIPDLAHGGREQGRDREHEESFDRVYSIFTREQGPSTRVKGSGLFSHSLYGVDNTGACDELLVTSKAAVAGICMIRICQSRCASITSDSLHCVD